MIRGIRGELNPLDRIVAFFSPEAGVNRLKARSILAMAGGYTAGSKSRRSMSEWLTFGRDADSDILPDLDTIRQRSRDLVRNNPLAGGALNTKITNIVGSGLRLQSWIDAETLGLSEEEASEWERQTESEFRLWAESCECDLERELNFNSIQELAFRSVLENGDIFINFAFLERSGSPYGLKLQLIEADRITNPNNQMDRIGLSGGVERDKHGAPTAYHVMTVHPGNTYASERQWMRLEAFGDSTGRRKILHLYRKLRVGQSRGVPDLAPVVEALKQLGDYAEAEITAAVVSGLFAGFIISDSPGSVLPQDPTASSSGKDDVTLRPGLIGELHPGEDIKFSNPGRPNTAFDGFVTAVLRQVGVGLELPFEVLVKHFTASYSAARAALLEAWRFFRTRRQWLAENLCQQVYEAFLFEAVARGRIYAPGFMNGDDRIRKAYARAKWIGPAPGQIDPLKEIKAAEMRVNMGVSTLTQEAAEITGDDWENLHAQRVKEARLREKDGLQAPLDDDEEADRIIAETEDEPN